MTPTQLAIANRAWANDYDFAIRNGEDVQPVIDRMPPLPPRKPFDRSEVAHLRSLAESEADGWGVLDSEVERYRRYDLSDEERRAKYGKPLVEALIEYGLYELLPCEAAAQVMVTRAAGLEEAIADHYVDAR